MIKYFKFNYHSFFIIQSNRFLVHKVVMAASCDHFELNSDDHSSEMTFDKIEPDMMKRIIDFCYMGKFGK